MGDDRAVSQRVLVTIPISHYCEKARWALDRARLDYAERRHLPGLHRVAVKRAGGKLTAPVLVCEGGVLAESADIIAWADERAAPERRVIPEDPDVAAEACRLAADYDKRLGPHTRRWVYYGLRDRPDLSKPSITAGVPGWQRSTFRITHAPILFVVGKALNITPETAEKSERKMRAVMDEVGARLADGRRYLVGDRFTTADLTFAALAAPLVLPREYGVPLPTAGEMPPAMATVIREMQAHPGGAHALAMFRDERR
jgi:glutathione S-transferase